MSLIHEIGSYWRARAEGYSQVNRQELYGLNKAKWLYQIQKWMPEENKKETKVLDMGTGPGFFAIILAEAGYKVSAVDYTVEMLVKAKENAGSLNECINFFNMDAQCLAFEDDTFDVVVSRNLTWVLEAPEIAYREWGRVLKKGGVLLNFDANWYQHLFDAKARQQYEEDRTFVKENDYNDHYVGTDINKMEAIAKKVPLSRCERPRWDKEILERLGFNKVNIDTDVWQNVWNDEEKANYRSTPMFLVAAEL